MMPANLCLGDTSFYVKAHARNVRCCSGFVCCSQIVDDPVNIPVHTQESSRGGNRVSKEVEVSESTIVIYDTQKRYLRAIESRDIPFMNKQHVLDRIYKATVAKLYTSLSSRVGPELCLIASMWQGVDLLDMSRNATPLRVSHLMSIHQGLQTLLDPLTKKVFDIMVKFCKDLTRKTPTEETPIISSSTRRSPICERRLSQLSFDSIKKILNVGKSKGLMNVEEACVFGHKFAGLVVENHHSKSVASLLENFTVITKDDAGKFLLLVSQIRDVFEKLETCNESQEDVLQFFAKKSVRVESSSIRKPKKLEKPQPFNLEAIFQSPVEESKKNYIDAYWKKSNLFFSKSNPECIARKQQSSDDSLSISAGKEENKESSQEVELDMSYLRINDEDDN